MPEPQGDSSSIGSIDHYPHDAVARSAGLRTEFVEFRLAPVSHDYASAFTCESCRDGAPQRAGTASDQRDLILKARFRHHCFLISFVFSLLACVRPTLFEELGDERSPSRLVRGA